jgi:hypothetical protein
LPPNLLAKTPERELDMRNPLVALAVVVCIALSQSAPAKELTSVEPAQNAVGSSLNKQLSELLHQLGIRLIPKARAAECTEEGETCTSTEQCCAGLECSGGPPATCTTEE